MGCGPVQDGLGRVARSRDDGDEHGERFHQDLKYFEQRYQGFWDPNMLGDYCWSIIRETAVGSYKKKRKISRF
jgi:hypothetical protein